MNLKEIALQNRKSCAVALPSNRTAQLLDDLSPNMRNSQRNHSATDSLQPLKNIDSICNLQRNTSATGQNLTAQLLPQKTPQKLRTKNTELHTKSEEKSPVFGGGNSVISANSTNQHKVSTRLELINHGTITARIENNPIKKESHSQAVDGRKKPLANPQIEDGQLNRKSEDKQSPENLGDALKTEQTTAPNFRDTFTPMAETSDMEQQPPFSLNNYSHCVTCNQCEHLSLNGTCSRLGKRVNPQAMRECGSFQLLKKERPQIEEVKPYTHAELKALLNQVAKPLYFHLIDCEQCSLEDARYCSDGMTLGNRFDDLLLCFDDAADKRYKLMNQVIKARVSGRRAFESLFSDNAPLPRQDAPITRKWGNTKEYEAFINHWTACQVCKPNLGRYCSEGQQLEKEANC